MLLPSRKAAKDHNSTSPGTKYPARTVVASAPDWNVAGDRDARVRISFGRSARCDSCPRRPAAKYGSGPRAYCRPDRGARLGRARGASLCRAIAGRLASPGMATLPAIWRTGSLCGVGRSRLLGLGTRQRGLRLSVRGLARTDRRLGQSLTLSTPRLIRAERCDAVAV